METLRDISGRPKRSTEIEALVGFDWIRAALWIATAQVLVLSIALPLLGGLTALAGFGTVVLACILAAIYLNDPEHLLFRVCLHLAYAASMVALWHSIFDLGLPGSLPIYYAPLILLGAANILGVRAACCWAIPCIAMVAAAEFLPRPPRVQPGNLEAFIVGTGVLLTVLAFSVTLRRAYDRQAAKLEYLATTDSLTGLANRLELDAALRHALRRADRFGRRGAVVYIDVDGLKPVNDSIGHKGGDVVLREMARRIRDLTREVDTAARSGGDEFVVLLSEYDDPKGAEIFARKLSEKLLRPIDAGGHILTLSASIGIAVFPCAEPSAEGVMALADAAMYAAKKAGGACVYRATGRGPVAVD